MTINAASLALIKFSEGFVSHWYPDPGTGGEPWTCYYGHTSAAGNPKYPAKLANTLAEAEAVLIRDLAGAEATVARLVKVTLNENQRGALVSFVFNVGEANFASSTLLRLLNVGEYAQAAGEFSKWNHAAGKVMPGLTTRRAAEAKLFITPVEAVQSTTLKPIIPGPFQPKPASLVTTFWQALIAAILSLFARKP